jgi:hypothetical protein
MHYCHNVSTFFEPKPKGDALNIRKFYYAVQGNMYCAQILISLLSAHQLFALNTLTHTHTD